MSNKEAIDKALREYLLKADNLRNEDKLAYLNEIFGKYLGIEKMDHLITSNDLFLIISDAKSEFVKIPNNPQISRKPLVKNEFVAISVIEAYTTYLNKNDLLKRMPMIDYTDSSSDYEEFE